MPRQKLSLSNLSESLLANAAAEQRKKESSHLYFSIGTEAGKRNQPAASGTPHAL